MKLFGFQPARWLSLAVVTAGLAASQARADLALVPGGSVSPSADTSFNGGGGVAPGATFVSSASFTYTGVGFANGVTLTENVYKEGSSFDFLYQITNKAGNTSDIESLRVTTYGTYTTSVGYTSAVPVDSAGLVAGAIGPDSVARTPGAGNAVTFDFSASPIGNPVGSVGVSDILFIRTNATGYNDLGSASFSGTAGGSFNLVLGQPAIPEPGPMALAGIGSVMTGIAAGFRRLRKKAS